MRRLCVAKSGRRVECLSIVLFSMLGGERSYDKGDYASSIFYIYFGKKFETHVAM